MSYRFILLAGFGVLHAMILSVSSSVSAAYCRYGTLCGKTLLITVMNETDTDNPWENIRKVYFSEDNRVFYGFQQGYICSPEGYTNTVNCSREKCSNDSDQHVPRTEVTLCKVQKDGSDVSIIATTKSSTHFSTDTRDEESKTTLIISNITQNSCHADLSVSEVDRDYDNKHEDNTYRRPWNFRFISCQIKTGHSDWDPLPSNRN